MSLTIWKFVLDDAAVQKIRMPSGSRLLHVAAQHDELALWAIVNSHPGVPTVDLAVSVVGTGHPVPYGFDHLGTVLTAGGNFVWHVFARLNGSGVMR